MTETDTLERLVAEAISADRSTRVERYRDRLAAYGQPALDRLKPLAADPALGAFAILTIGAAAKELGAAKVASTLRDLRPKVRDDSTRRLLDGIVGRLLPNQRPAGPASDPSLYGIPASGGVDWPGFRAGDFGNNAGTSWRSRNSPVSMAPIITVNLRQLDPRFMSSGVTRAPEIHFAVVDRYRLGGEVESNWRAAKLVVYAHAKAILSPDGPAPGVVAGLYIEKASDQGEDVRRFGALDPGWDWPWFLRGLADRRIRDQLETVLLANGLSIGDYTGDRFNDPLTMVGWIGRFEAGELVLRNHDGTEIGDGWDDPLPRLQGLPASAWHNLHIWRTWPAHEAMAMGRPFMTELRPVLRDLAEVYLEIVAPARSPEARSGVV